jgi:hypothetical protein
VTRWLALLLVVVGCSPNYCPDGPVVFAVVDARLMNATQTAVSQLAPHLPVPVSVVAIADVTTRQWNSAEVWTVESVVEGETFTSACNPVAGKPNTFVGAETSPEHQAIFVCEFDIEAGATRLVLHEIGHVIGGPDHSDDPRDIMHRVPADRSTYTTNDIAMLTATCG